jgi:hypothetical protein
LYVKDLTSSLAGDKVSLKGVGNNLGFNVTQIAYILNRNMMNQL